MSSAVGEVVVKSLGGGRVNLKFLENVSQTAEKPQWVTVIFKDSFSRYLLNGLKGVFLFFSSRQKCGVWDFCFPNLRRVVFDAMLKLWCYGTVVLENCSPVEFKHWASVLGFQCHWFLRKVGCHFIFHCKIV
jgi:hypothetical protein